LHARRQSFPAFAEIAVALREIWPAGEVVSVEEIGGRLGQRWPASLVEAAIWKVIADAAAGGHLLVDLERFTLDRKLPLALLPPDAAPIVPEPLPDTLLPEPEAVPAKASLEPRTSIPGPTFDASTLPEQLREHFHRNLQAVEQVLAGAPQTRIAAASGIPRSTLGRLVRRTKLMGQIACVPRGSYARSTTMHPAFQECIRRLYLLPTQMSMTAIHEHWEQAVAQSGVPPYLGSPDDLKLLLMKAINRKTPSHGYRVHDGNRLSFQGRWYICPGLLSRLQGREFEVYYDRRDVSVLYLFVEGSYVGEAYCPQLMGGRVSEWEARAMRKHDEMQEALAREQGRQARARTQDEAASSRKEVVGGERT